MQQQMCRHNTASAPEERILQLIVLCHLVLHLKYTGFACRVVNIGVVAEGELVVEGLQEEEETETQS